MLRVFGVSCDWCLVLGKCGVYVLRGSVCRVGVVGILWFWGFDAEFSGCLGVCFDEFWVFTWSEVVDVLWLCLSRFLGYLWDVLGLLLC